MSDRSRRRLRTTITILVTALLVAPAAALATHGFTDVGGGDFYHAAVDWMKDNGVTAGCNPPDNTRYCPDDPVTRGEMAVFLERLDSKDVFLRPGEGPGGDGVDGGNADTVDGKHASDFLGTNATATDSAQLDGKDAGEFAGGEVSTAQLRYDETDVTINSATDTEILKIDFTAPDPCGGGTTTNRYMLQADGSSKATNGNGNTRVALTVDTSTIDTDETNRIYSAVAESDGTSNRAWATSKVFEVAPGAHTARLMGDSFTGSLDIDIEAAHLALQPLGWTC